MSKFEIPDVPEHHDEDWHQLVADPEDLRRKVPSFGGVDPAEAFVREEAIIRQMVHQYLDELGRDIKELDRFGAEYLRHPSRENLKPIYRLIHNMRGQGATFNYPLVTEIGKSFCEYYIELPDNEDHSVELILDHLNALKLVYRHHLEGQGDKLARAVSDSLRKAVHLQINKNRD